MNRHPANRQTGLYLLIGCVALAAGIGYMLRPPLDAPPDSRPAPPRDPATAVFDRIYESAVWGMNALGQGTSGVGSTEEVTRAYRKFLENLIREEGIASVVDAGCGDWEFSRYIDWGGAEYLGIDVSSVALERAKSRYSGPSIGFEQGSLVEALPPADLLIVKDVLQHLTRDDIFEFIRNNLRAERYRIAVLTNDRYEGYAANNGEIHRGGYRGLDLARNPFELEGLEDHQLFEVAPHEVGMARHKVTQVLRLRQDVGLAGPPGR